MSSVPLLTRAFLSHSSVDKPFVQQVFEDLGPTLAELDEVTFEPAKFNRDVIVDAMGRCSVFVLFASRHGITSSWVALEIKEALTRIKDRRLARVIVYCADKATFNLLDPDLRNFNVVRIEQKPLICARQIRGILAEVYADQFRTDVFISRDENLAELKRLVIDPSKNYRSIAVSGFDRLGRRTLVRKFCQDVYASFTPPSQGVVVDVMSSYDDIFRQLLALQYKNLEQAILAKRLAEFSTLPEHEQLKQVGFEIKSIYQQKEFIEFIDIGGLIGDDGDLSLMFQQILAQNSDITDLVHILILHRNAPEWVKRKYPDIAFYRLPPLTDTQAEVAFLHELKKRKATLSREEVTRLVSIADGHPANIDYVTGYIFHGGALSRMRLDEVLNESAEFETVLRN